MGWIYRGLTGDEDLWKIVWIYTFLGIFLAYVLNVILRLAFGIDFDHPTPIQETVLVGAKIIYGLWVFISAWRCASNTDSAFWTYVIRVVLIGYIVLSVYVYYQFQSYLDPFTAIDKSVDYVRALDLTTKK